MSVMAELHAERDDDTGPQLCDDCDGCGCPIYACVCDFLATHEPITEPITEPETTE